MQLDKKTVKTLMLLILFAVVLNAAVHNLGAVTGGIDTLLGILSPLLIGLALAFLLNIPMHFFEEKVFKVRGKRALKMQAALRRPLSLTVSVLLVIFVVGGVSTIVLPRLASAVTGLLFQLPVWVDNIKAQLLKFEDNVPEIATWIEAMNIDWKGVQTAVVNFFKQGLGVAMNSAVSVATSVFGKATSAVLACIFAITALCRKERLIEQVKRVLRAFLKPTLAENVIDISRMTLNAFSGFISGQLMEAVILGVLCFLGMLLFHFPQAFLISTMVCVSAVVPIFGAFLSAFVGALLIALTNGLGQAFGFVVFFVILQQIEGNVIYPRVVGNTVGLPAIWVLVAITVGGGLLGIIGMLISIPLFAVAYTLLREAVKAKQALKKRANA